MAAGMVILYGGLSVSGCWEFARGSGVECLGGDCRRYVVPAFAWVSRKAPLLLHPCQCILFTVLFQH